MSSCGAVAADAPGVLLVEDDDAMREALGYALRARGWRVRQAANGGAALATLARHRPDAIVLDLLLSDMHGTEVIRRVRGTPALAAIPILVLTAHALAAHAARVVGADALLLEPAASDEVERAVTSLVER